MFSNRIFQVTFFISLLAHGAILLQNPNLNILPHVNKKEHTMELSYIKSAEKPLAKPPEVTQKRELPLKSSAKFEIKKIAPPPFIDKENIFSKPVMAGHVLNKPDITKPDIIAVKKKITLPPVDTNKIDNPSYISYYQVVREKIRRAAYQNYFRTETGEVYLSFVISNDGTLKEVQLNEEKSSPQPFLKQIAARSIKDASPFPAFPKELDYPKLSFNIVISFEIE